MEHDGGRVTKEKESEATIDDVDGSKSGESVDLLSSGPSGDENPEMVLDLVQSDTEDDVIDENQNKVLQNEKATDEQTFLRFCVCRNTNFFVQITKAGVKRAGQDDGRAAAKKGRASEERWKRQVANEIGTTNTTTKTLQASTPVGPSRAMVDKVRVGMWKKHVAPKTNVSNLCDELSSHRRSRSKSRRC